MKSNSSITLPTKITLLRIVLVIPFAAALINGTRKYLLTALIILTIAAFTDYLDGRLARRRNQVSDLGKFLDPLADKLFFASAFIIFTASERLSVPAWVVILIISREFIINSLRTYGLLKGTVIAASGAGKIKTVVQIAAIYLIIIMLMAEKFLNLSYYISAAAAAVTLITGLDYIIRNREIFSQSDQGGNRI